MVSKSLTINSFHRKKTLGFKNKVKILLGTICCLLLGFFVVLSLPVYLFRFLVILMAKLFRPDLGNILNGTSCFLGYDYFYNKKAPRSNILVSVYLQGRTMPIQELKEILMERWIRAKDDKTGKSNFQQFQQYPEQWLGFIFYKNYANTFDINNHVFVHDQSHNERDFVDDSDLNNICEKLLNAHYKQCTSPWEVHLVKNYKSNNLKTYDPTEEAYVIIFKFHHCLADGYSILTAIVEGFGQLNLKDFNLPKPRFPKRNLRQQIFYYISFPVRCIYELSYFNSHMFRSSPWKIPDEKKEWYQHCAKSDLISIEKVKFVKSKFDVSFMSVVLYAISSAIHKTLQNAKDKNLSSSQFKRYLEDEDNSIYCMSLLPLPRHSKGLTNQFTTTVFDLPIGNIDSVVNGLREIDHELENTKKSGIPAFVPIYLASVGCHFYPIGHFIGKQRSHHIGLSNFPSLPVLIEENGRKCFAVDFMNGGLDGVAGSLVQVLSYGENIRIAITADKAVLSKDEIENFASYMTEEIDHLFNEASLNCNVNRLSNLHAEGENDSLHPSQTQAV